MNAPLPDTALDQAFRNARTFNRFTDRPVDDATLGQLYDLLKWGPTSMNCQPARYVFIRSAEAKARLKPCLAPGNADKTMAAPLTVIVATDPRFYEQLPSQFPPNPGARDLFAGNAALAESTAFRNGTLQGGYLILAARMLGLDCGPMSGFDIAKANAEFFAESGWQANFLVNLGYGDPVGNHPRGPRLGFNEVTQIL
ncbi:MAG TPA: malonic semialdehyde reductase [Rhodocyclaceae bacterium]